MPKSPPRTKTSQADARDWDILRASSPADYTGATGFERMSPLQRLRWLDMAAQFVASQKPSARPPHRTMHQE